MNTRGLVPIIGVTPKKILPVGTVALGMYLSLSQNHAILGSSVSGFYYYRNDGIWAFREKLVTGDEAIITAWNSASVKDSRLALTVNTLQSSINVPEVFFYSLDGGSWVLDKKIVGEDFEEWNDCSIEGDTAFVGSPLSFCGPQGYSGAAYVFEEVVQTCQLCVILPPV